LIYLWFDLEVEKKFSKFKAFILSVSNISNLYAQAIQMCTLETFLIGFKQFNNKTTNKIINLVSKKTNKARQSKFKVDFKFKVGLNSKSG
jgi:hypothetical protein